MAVRKFLDENGAAKLNELLANKFQTKIDKADGNIITVINTSEAVNVWELSAGLYTVVNNTDMKVRASGTKFNLKAGGLMLITIENTRVHFIAVCGTGSSVSSDTCMNYMYEGWASSNGTIGSSTTSGKLDKALPLLLTKNNIINNLTISADNNNNALSAHQGYVLDQNKENISNKVISISSSSTDDEYPSAKCVYNLVGDVESILQTLNSGNGV